MAKACWFLVFAGVWWLPLMMLVVAEEHQGGDCSAEKCGKVSISDPFWLTDKDTGRSCGSDPYSDFDVACINNTYPALRSSIPLDNGFEILNISYEQRSLYAVDLGKRDLLHARNSCQTSFYNTSFKLNRPFRIAPVNLNLILYNCTEKDGAAAAARRHTELAPTRVRCGNEWEVLAHAGVPYDATRNYSNYALKGCAAIVVPVPGSSAEANASDYEQLFNDGFLLKWNPPPHPYLLPDIRPGVQAQAACEPERCGNLTVSSPFGIISGSEENRCAQLGFQIHCIHGIPYLAYYERGYGLQILDIFYSNGSLLVSDVHKLDDFNLPGEKGCHVPKANTASKFWPTFSISPLNQNLIFFNCTKPLAPEMAAIFRGWACGCAA